MMKRQMNSFKHVTLLCDYQETIMPSAGKAERLYSTCLIHTGSSGYLEPGLSVCRKDEFCSEFL